MASVSQGPAKGRVTGDPLLAATTVATVLARIALGIGMIGLSLTLFAAVFRPDLFERHLLVGIGSGPQDNVPIAAIASVGLTITAFALLYDFAARLAKIIATVRHGDPFTLANAARLNRMGWLAMSVLGINIAQTLISMYLPTNGMDTHLSLTGLAVGLVLFVLARVFRNGAAMRDDLEGTV